MKVHFFYTNRSNESFYKVTMDALLEEDVYSSLNREMQKSFRYLEKINVFISKDPTKFQTVRFDIDFGKDGCRGHFAKSVEELYQAKQNIKFEGNTPISQCDYERIRKVVFAIYQKNICMNFSLVEGPQKSSIRLLDHL